MIKRAIALTFCLLLLCSYVAAAATNTNLTDSKHTSNDSKDKQATSQGKVTSLSNSTENSKNNSSSSDSNIKSEEVDNGNFLTNAVSSGIALFLKGLFDGMYTDVYADGYGPGETGTITNGTEYTNSTYDGIYTAITSVPHPYEDDKIVKLYGGYLNLTLFCISIFVFGALTSRSIARMKLNKNLNLTQSAFVGGIATCLFALVTNIIYAGILDTIEVLNNFITLPAMPALAPDPSNLLLCIVQTFCDLVLFVFFIIRYYILYIVAVGCSIIAVLLVPEFTRDFSEKCLEKIARILALQPAALFVYVVCVISADSLPGSLKAFAHIGTTVMVSVTCWYFMFGNFTLLKRGISYTVRKGVGKI